MIRKGIAAGFVATLVLSVLMLLKAAVGVAPDLNVIVMLDRITGTGAFGGWVIHFFIGTLVWGVLFALLDPILVGAQWFRGMLFATGAWLLMMVFVMPIAGAGYFGAAHGPVAAVATLVLHLIYGAVLGAVFGWELNAVEAQVVR